LSRRRTFGQEDVAGPLIPANDERRAVGRPSKAAEEYTGGKVRELLVRSRVVRLDNPDRSGVGPGQYDGSKALPVRRPDDEAVGNPGGLWAVEPLRLHGAPV